MSGELIEFEARYSSVRALKEIKRVPLLGQVTVSTFNRTASNPDSPLVITKILLARHLNEILNSQQLFQLFPTQLFTSQTSGSSFLTFQGISVLSNQFLQWSMMAINCDWLALPLCFAWSRYICGDDGKARLLILVVSRLIIKPLLFFIAYAAR